ncbi:MAG TPA: helix-turn-helix transcriptional regulator [Saprospiraceae bacterium]|nr:helix-turn-helix transcriptional regulator [Saprospiraceae bacterium]
MATKALVAASTKPLVLSILSYGENYGYQIIKEVEQLSQGELSWTDAMLYPVLSRMEKEGLIASNWVKMDTGRKRKYYQITTEGQKRLERERRQWLNVNRVFIKLWGMDEKPYQPDLG